MSRFIVQKFVGETPLKALERFRAEHVEAGVPGFKEVPMAYAGRLDPMASGKLLILVGDDCKKKEKYLDLDKTYEVEILFGIETDSYDILGLAKLNPPYDENILRDSDLAKYVGKFKQEYPPYSSKTVGGKQLHELARSGNLPKDMPTKDVEIYSIDFVAKRVFAAKDLLHAIDMKIGLVKGDFRQQEILARWNELLSGSDRAFHVVKVVVSCSSGTYMRSLAQNIGRDLGIGALALSIDRTEIKLDPSS